MIDATNRFFRSQPAIAKIGKRYYWSVWRYGDWDADEDGPVRLADGFAATRADAAEQIVAADASISWPHAFEAKNGCVARGLYDKHHKRKLKLKAGAGHAVDHGNIWYFASWSEDERYWGWESTRVTKVTPKRIFAVDPNHREKQISLDRSVLQRDGSVWSRACRERFHTEADMEVTCPVSSDHAQLETTTLVAAVDCPSRDDEATGWGAEAPWAAARRPVACAGAASRAPSRAANSAGVR